VSGEPGLVDELRALGLERPLFVDCHSHCVPSGDDGVRTMDEAVGLCGEAARRGTRLLFATPHASPDYPLTSEREAAVRKCHRELCGLSGLGLELRLGFEVAPHPSVLDEDPARYVLEGTRLVLVEGPLSGSVDVLVRVAEHVEACGWTPAIAHPEECIAVANNRRLALALAERGWPLVLSSRGLLGRSGQIVERVSWFLLESGCVAAIASDGHGMRRPPFLDAVYALLLERCPELAEPLLDGRGLRIPRPGE
jgi:protein-tyrosine phosphatase